MNERVIHVKWDEQKQMIVDCGECIVLGEVTVYMANVLEYQCKECAEIFDASWWESYRVEINGANNRIDSE